MLLAGFPIVASCLLNRRPDDRSIFLHSAVGHRLTVPPRAQDHILVDRGRDDGADDRPNPVDEIVLPEAASQCWAEGACGIHRCTRQWSAHQNITNTVRPMPKPPIFGARGSTAVPKTARSRKNVRTASMRTPRPKETPGAKLGVPSRAACQTACGYMTRSRRPARVAPTSWATIYRSPRRGAIRLVTRNPTVTAGG